MELTETVEIEVALAHNSSCRSDSAELHVSAFLRENYAFLAVNTVITEFEDYSIIKDNVDRIYVVQASSEITRLEQAELKIHVYQLRIEESQILDDEDNTFAVSMDLPAKSLDSLWETLVLEKDMLLRYVSTMMLFSDRGVNPLIVSMNRLILLHGPPGTGKTSLCRGKSPSILT